MNLKFSKDFPVINQKMNEFPLCYLDSGASALKLKRGTDILVRYADSFSCNIHRGVYKLSSDLTQRYENAREKVAHFIGAPTPHSIVFNSGTTMGINQVARMLIKSELLKKGDEVLVSIMEHHANIVPWLFLQKEFGIKVVIIPMDESKKITVENIKKKQTNKTRVIACTHISNVLGGGNPIKEITQFAKKNNILTLIDGAQAVPHQVLNMKDLDCDFYVFSGHKVFAPTGVGVLYGRKEILDDLSPILGGGDMILSVSWDRVIEKKSPYKFEAGTPPIAQAIALGESLSYIESLGFEDIQKIELGLKERMLEAMKGIKRVKLLNDNPSIPLFTFTFEGVHPHDLGSFLDDRGIAIRVGHHCAEPLLEEMGVKSTARASFSFYNDEYDIQRLTEALIQAGDFFCEYE